VCFYCQSLDVNYALALQKCQPLAQPLAAGRTKRFRCSPHSSASPKLQEVPVRLLVSVSWRGVLVSQGLLVGGRLGRTSSSKVIWIDRRPELATTCTLDGKYGILVPASSGLALVGFFSPFLQRGYLIQVAYARCRKGRVRWTTPPSPTT